MSRPVAHRPVLTRVFELSGKGTKNRIAIYPLCVFPNVTLWPSRSPPDTSSLQE